MKLTNQIHHLKLRHKFAALGVVAVAMVATPLVQVLRYQTAEIQAALYEQAGLDPVSGAVTLQHALLAHRDIAGLVLRGVLQLEPERTMRQAEVDDRAATLEATLITLKLPRAVGEAQALRQDWVTLVPQVEQRRITSVDSDAAHRLLVEQALQVIDLVAAASGLDSHGAAKTYLASVRGLSSLPHVTAQIAALGLPAESGAERGDVAAAEAALARALGHLSDGINRGALSDPLLSDAVATAGVTADRLFHLRRQADPADAATRVSFLYTTLPSNVAQFINDEMQRLAENNSSELTFTTPAQFFMQLDPCTSGLPLTDPRPWLRVMPLRLGSGTVRMFASLSTKSAGTI
jgi:hypothetical protein